METIYPNQIAEMPQHKGLKFQSLTVFINVKLTFVDKEHKNNVCFIENSSRLSSVLLLCSLRIFMKQTLSLIEEPF